MNAIRELYLNSGLLTKDNWLKFDYFWIKIPKKPVKWKSVDKFLLIKDEEFEYIRKNFPRFKELLDSLGFDLDLINKIVDIDSVEKASLWVKGEEGWNYVRRMRALSSKSDVGIAGYKESSCWCFYTRFD